MLSGVLLALAVWAAAPATPAAEPSAAVQPSSAEAAPIRSLRLKAVGDVLFARYRANKADPKGRPVLDRVSESPEPFAGVKDLLSAADVTFANIECPVLPEPEGPFTIYRSLTFRAEPSDLEVLKAAGFDLLSLANNHAANFGTAGALATRRHVDASGLLGAGTGATHEEALAPVFMVVNGLKLALVAASVWDNWEKQVGEDGAVAHIPWEQLEAELVPRVQAVRALPDVDFVLVSLHWGIEYKTHPEAAQRQVARALVDAGADVILGHHPHMVQDVERHAHGLIVYSMGNFMFDARSLNTRESLVLEVVLERQGARHGAGAAVLHPVLIHPDRHEPTLAAGKDYCRMRERYQSEAVSIAESPDGTTCGKRPLREARR